MTSTLKAALIIGLLGAGVQEPRELTSDKEHWINSDRALKLSDQVGKVVFLEFGVLR